MIRLAVPGLLLLGLVVPMARADVHLAWKWRKGERFYVDYLQQGKGSLDVKSKDSPGGSGWDPTRPPIALIDQTGKGEIAQTIHAMLSFTVLDTKPDGSVDLEVGFVSVENPTEGVPRDDKLRFLENQGVLARLNPRLDVVEIVGVEDLLRVGKPVRMPVKLERHLAYLLRDQIRYWINNIFCPVPAGPVRAGTNWQQDTSLVFTGLGHWTVTRTITYRKVEPAQGRELHLLDVKGKTRILPPTWDQETEDFRNEGVTLTSDDYQGTIHFDAAAGRITETNITTRQGYRSKVRGAGIVQEGEVKGTGAFTVRFLDRSPLADRELPRRPAKAEELLRAEPAGLRRRECNSAGIWMMLVPRGKFVMGAPLSEPGRLPDEEEHEVELTRPFYLGAHEVTVGQFRKFVEETGYQTEAESDYFGGHGYDPKTRKFTKVTGYSWKNPGFPQTELHPVVNVSWNDAQAFCAWLTRKEGKKYRLPTEAEWEHACRAGTTTRFWWGEDIREAVKCSNLSDDTLKEHNPEVGAVPGNDGAMFTTRVGSYRPNPLGLYDMIGNVHEWCQDFYTTHDGKPQKDPTGPESGFKRVIRGSDWNGSMMDARSARRMCFPPPTRYSFLGFRVLMEAR